MKIRKRSAQETISDLQRHYDRNVVTFFMKDPKITMQKMLKICASKVDALSCLIR